MYSIAMNKDFDLERKEDTGILSVFPMKQGLPAKGGGTVTFYELRQLRIR